MQPETPDSDHRMAAAPTGGKDASDGTGGAGPGAGPGDGREPDDPGGPGAAMAAQGKAAPDPATARPQDRSVGRLELHAVIGAAGGLAIQMLWQATLNDPGPARLIGAAAVWAVAFFLATLLTGGTLRFRLGASYAAGHGLVVALLALWASLRHDRFHDFLAALHPLAALALLIALPLPFVLAHETAPRGARDYGCLFDNAWAIFVKAVVATVFALGLLGILAFSAVMIAQVGWTAPGAWLKQPAVLAAVLGGGWGLALGVLSQMRATVLALRSLAIGLLRLLTPVATATSALVLLRLPFQGLSETFPTLSTAGTLLALTALGITLVTAVADADDAKATSPRWLKDVARLQALMLPPLALVALVAIWQRVDAYGWTVPRLSAGTMAITLSGYAVGYALAVLRGTGGKQWLRGVRTTNAVMAVILVLLAALWLTPVIDAERITARDQGQRLIDGRTPPERFPGALLHRLGRAGREELEQLGQQSFGDARDNAVRRALRARDRVDESGSGLEIDRRLRVWPDDASLPSDAANLLARNVGRDLRQYCPVLDAPRCAYVARGLGGPGPVTGLLLIPRRHDLLWVEILGDPPFSFRVNKLRFEGGMQADRIARAIAEGRMAVAPALVEMLTIEGISLWPTP